MKEFQSLARHLKLVTRDTEHSVFILFHLYTDEKIKAQTGQPVRVKVHVLSYFVVEIPKRIKPWDESCGQGFQCWSQKKSSQKVMASQSQQTNMCIIRLHNSHITLEKNQCC